MATSLAARRSVSIAHLGPEGTYGHQPRSEQYQVGRDVTIEIYLKEHGKATDTPNQAAVKAFPDSRLEPFPTITSVFEHVQAYSGTNPNAPRHLVSNHKNILLGIVPFHNSTNGFVPETLQVIARPTAWPVEVLGEVLVSVRHCLLGRKPVSQESNIASGRPRYGKDAMPDLSHVRTIYSHSQVWGQCEHFTKAIGAKVPPSIPTIDSSPASDLPVTPEVDGARTLNPAINGYDALSTSAAAALAASDSTGSTAAISSALAADIHGLDILLEGLEDDPKNMTRFLIIGQSTEAGVSSVDLGSHAELAYLRLPQQRRRALMMFVLRSSQSSRPGALVNALSVFERHRLSLTSINSTPRGNNAVSGHSFVIEIDVATAEWFEVDPNMSRGCEALDLATEDLDQIAVDWQWSGTWWVQPDDTSFRRSP